MGAHLTLAQVRNEEDGDLYPRDRLEGLSTCLAGFCAAFLGRQDCVWVADAGLQATCVDTDLVRLAEMAALYPDSWTFEHADLFEYARTRYAHGDRFDLVTLDPPTNLFDRVADTAWLWCGLASRLVVIGTGHYTVLDEPDGWEITSVRRRSHFRGGTYWTTLERV